MHSEGCLLRCGLHEGFSGDRFQTVGRGLDSRLERQDRLQWYVLGVKLGQWRGREQTSIMRNSLFGRSPSLICFTATASPVPQLKALYTEPNAPLPKHSPRRYIGNIVRSAYTQPLQSPRGGGRHNRSHHPSTSKEAFLQPAGGAPLQGGRAAFSEQSEKKKRKKHSRSPSGLGPAPPSFPAHCSCPSEVFQELSRTSLPPQRPCRWLGGGAQPTTRPEGPWPTRWAGGGAWYDRIVFEMIVSKSDCSRGVSDGGITPPAATRQMRPILFLYLPLGESGPGTLKEGGGG